MTRSRTSPQITQRQAINPARPVSSCRSSGTINPVQRGQFISALSVSQALECPALLIPQGAPFGASKGLYYYKPQAHEIFLAREHYQIIQGHVLTFRTFVPFDRFVMQVRFHEMKDERV